MGDAVRLRVFLSYARRDGAALADELYAGLQLLGFEPVLDRQDIAAAEDWSQRLETLIRQADTVVFLLSPASIASARCTWEVDRAIALSKRLVPVIAGPVPDAHIPPPLARLNFIDFTPGRSFVRSLGALAEALRVDLDWIREHTRLAELAQRWLDRQRDEALLLRGAELAAAQGWQAAWHAGAPAVTEPQRLYVMAAVDAEARREAHERQQLEAMAQANASRAEALQVSEAALRSLRRRTVAGAAAALALSATGGVLPLLYARATQQREAERVRADEALRNSAAEAARREALRTDLEGQMAVYATAPGQAALDDSGLTAGLVEELRAVDTPLSVAVSRVIRRVLDKSSGQQRPYVSTDLNGDVYMRVSPPSRRRHALVVSVDRAGPRLPFPGAPRDARVWHDFLRDCGFTVTWLQNPRTEDLMAALRDIPVASLSVPAPWVVRAGLVVTGPVAPAHPASSPAPAARPAPTPTPDAGTPLRGHPARDAGPPPSPNSFLAFYFAGGGVRLNGTDCLVMAGSDRDKAPGAFPVDTAVLLPVDTVSTQLRRRFAASCLVLDTNFPAWDVPTLAAPSR